MPLQNNNGNIPGVMFFAAYVGPSMNPTLREPEILEIRPYNGKPFRVGDVAFFLPPEADQPVVHRIVRVTPAGISTLGDNNSREDAFLLQPKSIKGRVVAAWRGQKRRKIAGGYQGRLTRRRLYWRRVLDRSVSPLLHPLYQALSRWRLIVRFVPPPFRPRVVVFQAQGRDQVQLLLGRRIIGRYDAQRHQWRIQRPFHVFVKGRAFDSPLTLGLYPRAGTADADPRAKPGAPAAAPAAADGRDLPVMTPLRTRDVLYNLVLADGSRWEIAAGDREAASIVSQLGGAMQLPLSTGAIEPPAGGSSCRLLVQVDAHGPAANSSVPSASNNSGTIVVGLDPCDNWGGPFVNLVRLSLILARAAQARGGVLLHGALVERDGRGVILVAPCGTGKTTASNRLPAPWRSLSDDATLVVRDRQGHYWAHPWPTWSRFLDGGPGGTWDVQRAMPLQGIFLLARADEDRVERLGPGRAVSLLVESVGQVSTFMAPGLVKDELRALHLEQFENLCGVVRAIPAHVLHFSLTGAFWQEMDRALAGISNQVTQETTGQSESD